MTLGARCVVISPDREVLLLRHSYHPGWHLPGGGVEKGETVLDALIREVREEAGVTMPCPPKLHGIFFNRKVSNKDHVVVYSCSQYETLEIEKTWEIEEVSFFSIDNLPKDIDPGTKRRIDEIILGHEPSDDW